MQDWNVCTTRQVLLCVEVCELNDGRLEVFSGKFERTVTIVFVPRLWDPVGKLRE
jgi:hypothetical protein